MADEYWLDYSAAKLSGATIRDAGYTGVVRYITHRTMLARKHTNRAEYQDHIANGLTVRLVMQVNELDADQGYTGGVQRAQWAADGAEYIGYDGPIFFTNDRTVVPNPALWQSYLDGGASVLGRENVGAYGFGNAIDLARGHAHYFWQAGRRSELRAHADLWQDNNYQPTVGGILTDRNLVLTDRIRSMAITDDDARRIASAVWGHPIKFHQLPNNPGGAASLHLEQANLSAQQANTKLSDLTNDEANVILAVRAMFANAETGDTFQISDEQIQILATAIVTATPEPVTAEKIVAALRTVFADAGTQ